MFKVTRRQFRNPHCNAAFNKIMHCSGLGDVKFAHQMAKMIRTLESESDLLSKVFVEYLKQFVKLDDKGEIVPFDGKPETYEIRDEFQKDPAKNAEYQKAMKDFEEIEIEIPHPKIPISKLGSVNLSPVELNALEPFLIDMEAVSSNVAPARKKK